MISTTATVTQDLHIRRATRREIDFVTWCNMEATSPAPGFCYWDPLLAGSATPTAHFIKTVFAHDALAWGRVEEFFVVEEAGRLLAGASGFPMDAQDYRPLRLDRLPVVADALGWEATVFADFLEAYTSVWPDPQDPVLAPQAPWIIECVAVVPEARGRGLSKALLGALFAEGQRLGHTHAGISVTNGNVAAERAYTAVGFQLYLRYGADYFNDAYPGSTKYRRRLGAG